MVTVETSRYPLSLQGDDLRGSAFDVYCRLLSAYPENQLLLLESLGSNAVDARVSLIGVNPILTLEVKDRVISIEGHEVLVESLASAAGRFACTQRDRHSLNYTLNDRPEVWEFLRFFERQFSEAPKSSEGIMVFSCFAYNTIHYIEKLPGFASQDDGLADISLVMYQSMMVIHKDAAELRNYHINGIAPANVHGLLECIQSTVEPDRLLGGDKADFSLRRETTRDSYLKKAGRALHHIAIGDVYQVQIGQKMEIRSPATPLQVYARLRQQNPSPYMYLFAIGKRTIVGASPELFARIGDDGEVLMRPIAGTLGKRIGLTRQAAEEHLHGDVKEVAEHMMLVDLCRNDLCRVCQPATLKVDTLLDIEEYSHVYHMVSTTRAKLRANHDKYDVIMAGFPAGTMTGTPKIRAMEIIADLEDSGRGLYSGALGIIGLGTHYINLALCIRSAVELDGVYTLRASAGIVSDSVPIKEHAETLHKMGSMFRAITEDEISCHAE